LLGKAFHRRAEHARLHIQGEKKVTRRAVTWVDRVSFVLADGLDAKRVAPLDVLMEKADGAAQDGDERRDSDLVLMTVELAKLLTELVEASGGERTPA